MIGRLIPAMMVAAFSSTTMVAQTPLPPSQPIVASDVGTYLEVMKNDSMWGPTPSPALERAARYLAGEFRALGLVQGFPEWNDTTAIARYPIPGQRQADYSTAGLQILNLPHRDTTEVMGEGGYALWHVRKALSFSSSARFLSPIMPSPSTRMESHFRSMVIVAGLQTVVSARAAEVAGRVVAYVPTADVDSATRQAIVQALLERSLGVVILSSADSTSFAAQVRAGAARPAVFAEPYLPQAEDRTWVAEIRAETIRADLALHGVDLTAVQAARVPLVQPTPFLQIRLLRELAEISSGPTAPNVIASLPGSDPILRRQWIVVTAPMDRIGTDSTIDAWGTTGLLALARAFAAQQPHPRRSILLVGTSGQDEEFGGIRSFLAAAGQQWQSIFAVALNLRGQPSRDSLALDGLREVDFRSATSPAIQWTLHRDLGLTLVDTGSVLTPGTGAGAFSNQWIPNISIRNAGRPESRVVSAEAGARVLSLVFHIAGTLANAGPADWPKWNTAAKQVLTTRPMP